MGAAKKLLDKKVLKDLVPLNALSAVHLDEISRKAEIETIRSGRYAFKAGERDHKSVYLLEGKVELLDDGRNIVGSVIGGSEAAHHPLAHKQPRQLSARASGSITIARIDSGLLDVLLTWDESSGYDVVEIGADDDGDWMTRMLQSQAFLQLPPSNIHQLLMRLESVSFRAGDQVIRQDEEGDYFYIVKSGRMAVSRKASARGKEVLLAELGEGACFGEEALVSDSSRNATVTMLTDGSLMRLSKDDFNELLRAPLVHEVDFTQAGKLAGQGAEWLDVRLPGEFDNQHIQGSRNFPLSALREQADTLDADKRYIVCCDTGRRSASGAFILRQRGFSVYTLKNGLMDVPAEALEGGTPEEQSVDSHDAEIIPFENERDTNDRAEPQARQEAETASRLEADLQASEAARDALQAEAETLREQLASLQHVLDETEKKHTELTQQLEEAQQACESGAGAKEQFEKQLAQLEAELERVRDDYQQLGQRTSAVAGERDAANRDLEKARAELETLQARIDSQQGELGEQVQAVQTQLDARQQALEEEIARRSAIEEDLAEAEKASRLAEEREAGLTEQVETLKQQTDEQRQQLQDAFQAEKGELEQQLQALQCSVEDYEQKLASQTGEYETLAGKLAEVEQQLTQSRENEQSLNEALENTRQQTDELEQRIRAGLQQELDTLGESLDSTRTAFDEASARLEESVARETQLNERISELEQQLLSREREFESDLGSAREAMSRAQTELDNLKREQQRLLDRLRKNEETRERERHDHEAEVHRLRRELQQAADGSAEGLTAELEALQAQVNENTRLRDDLEVRLGERSAQLEDMQARAEHFEQQLKLAQESAQAAEQQLVEANRLANEEMEIRLNTEQGIQDGLREALETSERERNAHQENITVITQELEELREAYRQSKQALEVNEGAASRLDEVEAQRASAEAERDELRSSVEALKQELDQLRVEAEVHRGLEDMLSDGGEDTGESEALQQAKQNVEVAVRLRAQAEARVESLCEEVEQLRTQLSQVVEAPAPAVPEGAIPSLDNTDPHASNPMLAEVPDIEEDDDEAPAVLLDEELVNLQPAAVPPQKSGLIKGMITGLIAGAVAGAGLFWWQSGSVPQVTLPPPSVSVTPGNVPEPVAEPVQQPEARPAKVEQATATEVPKAEMKIPEVKAPVPEKPVITTKDEVPADTPAPAATVPGSFPFARGMSGTPRTGRSETTTGEAGQASTTEAVVQKAGQSEETSATAPVPAADVTPEAMLPPEVDQPAGHFRDRLANGAPAPAMVRLHADRFLMGSSGISQQFDERPQHEVRLAPFAMAAREITFNDYDAFARATGHRLPDDRGWGRGERPVINVSWKDARDYAQWLSAQTGKHYRLPNEAEWEFVARSGATTRYWWGEGVGENHANCFDCGSRDGGAKTSPVASYAASPWGVYDMAGNVREWVNDCYTPNYSRAAVDGSAAETAGCSERVVRGGAYSSPSAQLRSTARDRMDAQSRLDNLGFRVVRED